MGNISNPSFIPAPAIIDNNVADLVSSPTVTIIANTVYLRAFEINAPTTIVAVGFQVGATATGKTNVGIYTLAGALVSGSDTGQITNTANSNNKTNYATPVVLQPGQYFVALSPSNSTDVYQMRSASNVTSLSRDRVAANTLSAGALPSTTGALSQTALSSIATLYTQNGLT